ncbi:hypothetical protein LP419_37095 [Massilia sp. H-1]|nr:hypothetical protein LP419_37095 [Massilia sp. H-1]
MLLVGAALDAAARTRAGSLVARLLVRTFAFTLLVLTTFLIRVHVHSFAEFENVVLAVSPMN